jgi:hypothetical protein
MANAKRFRATLRASDKALEDSPAISLTAPQRAEVARSKAADTEADTEAALARPTQLTPLQKQRLETSKTTLENQRPKRAARLENLRRKYSDQPAPESTPETP